MILYHGTSEKCALQILEKGCISPRSKTGIPNRWSGFPSAPDLVYLTNAYAPYFASCASSNNENWVIIEIDVKKLDILNLLPDEDFMEQATRRIDLTNEYFNSLIECGNSVECRTKWFRDNLYDFRGMTGSSIDGIGNCAYHGDIPLEAITRIVSIDPKLHWDICQLGLDPSITLGNYAVCGKRYRALTKWMCLRKIKTTDLFDGLNVVLPELVIGSNEKSIRKWKRSQDKVEEACRARDGFNLLWPKKQDAI